MLLSSWRTSCDLLEKSYFCSIANNFSSFLFLKFHVVICLKNRTFAVSQTTTKKTLCCFQRLWFAWKIVLLQYRKQPRCAGLWLNFRCDLLEKSYFCSIANNMMVYTMLTISVVICLKNRTFAVSQTTEELKTFPSSVLWFAWKIVLLQYRKQHITAIAGIAHGCDLLEKSYFCSIANNSKKKPYLYLLVVICLKNRTFAVSQTTIKRWNKMEIQLWFAWKIVLLQYRKQLFRFPLFQSLRCDLLEKSYFCSIANNHRFCLRA